MEPADMFLQLEMEMHQHFGAASNYSWTHDLLVEMPRIHFFRGYLLKPLSTWNYRGGHLPGLPEVASPLLKALGAISKGLVIMVLLGLVVIHIGLLIFGLPKKAPQHPTVQSGSPNSRKHWKIFLSLASIFVWLPADQYMASLPQMSLDLSSSEGMMSASVQLTVCVKAIVGLYTASLSDRIGRRPILIAGSCLLALGSFCCGCSADIGWFMASRFLLAIGESIEPVIYAVCRDVFPEQDERLTVIAALQVLGLTSQTIGPVFGSLMTEFFSWRCSFFVLAIVWCVLTFFAITTALESCPDGAFENQTYFSSLSKIMTPSLLCLLGVSAALISNELAFTSNTSFVAEDTYEQNETATLFVFLAFGCSGVIGVFLMQYLQTSQQLSAHQTVSVQVLFVTVVAMVSLLLTLNFSNFWWTFVFPSSLQGFVLSATAAPTTVLFFEPLEDCAGVAASIEILCKSLPPCIYCLFSTQSLVHTGIKSYMTLQSCTYVAVSCFFLCYMLSMKTPTTARSKEEAFENLQAEEG